MATECLKLDRALKSIKEMVNTSRYVNDLYHRLLELEKVDPDNVLSVKLRPLFLEAHDIMRSHTTDEGGTSRAIQVAMQIIKRDRSQMFSDVIRVIKPERIAEIIRASKNSSSPITKEMVQSVSAMLRFGCFRYRLVSDRSALEERLEYLHAFLRLTAERCIEHESMKDLFTYVEDVAYTAAQLCVLKQIDYVDFKLSRLLKRISPSSPEWRYIYLSVLITAKSSTSEVPMEAITMYAFVNGLIEDARGVLVFDLYDGILSGLDTFSSFLEYISLDRISPEELISHQSHMEALAIEAAILIYSSYGEEIDMKTTEITCLHLAFNHVDIQLYLARLLYCRTSTIIAPLKDLIVYVGEELIFLRTLFMDALEQCKEQTMITDLLTFIQSVTRQARSDLYTFSDNPELEDLSGEINLLHFQLLLKFKFIKAASRQIFPDISESSTLDHPTINLPNILPFNYEVIDSYLSVLKSSKLKIDEVLVGFHEYILDNLRLMDKTILTFTVDNEAKKFYCGLLLLVTYLIDPLVQCIDCDKKNDLSEGVVTILFFNKSRKVNTVLQFLAVASKLIDSEGSLIDLQKYKTRLEVQTLDLIVNAHEELTSLKAFLAELLSQPTELDEVDDFLMSAEVTAHKLAQISFFCYECFRHIGNDSDELRLLLLDYLQEIESVDVKKVFFPVLNASPCNMIDREGLLYFLLNHQNWMLNYDACSNSFLKNQILVVKDKLVYLGSFLADILQYRDMHQELKDLVKRVLDLKYICLFPIGDYRPAWYYMFYLTDMKQLLRFVEAEVEMICLKVPDLSSYSFPRTNGLGFLDCFLGKLEELLCSKLDLISKLKPQIVSVNEGLLCLRSFFDHLAEIYAEHDETCGLITRVSETAYKAEYVIDSCLTYSHPHWYKVLWISEVVENINRVVRVVRESCERKKIDVSVHKVTSTYVAPSLSANTPKSNEEMEGFQEAMDQIKKQLLGGTPQLDVISLVGMPGIGKTTLAEKIYNDVIVTRHFDVHAKCRVTQVYSWRELLLTVLNDVLEPADRTEKGDGEIADELRRILLTKRFLILIDDVWDYNAWDSLHMCFKDSRNGSRIILTTRLSDVASYAECGSNPHHLRLLRDDESWTLLQEQVFQGENCPRELVDVAYRIARLCGGLPLFIVLVAGVLKEKKKQAVSWEEVEERLRAQNMSSLGESMPIIGFSYKNLPDYLKPCFLYFGGLLKGRDIRVSKLTQLWLAEGFVQEQVHAAQHLLEDLISRNLVMGMKKRPNGKVKTCRVHDMLHQFCLETSKQENFLLRINRFRGEDVFPQTPKEYRLFVHSSQDQIDLWQPSHSTTRSLIVSVIDLDRLLWPRDISFIFESFKLVKVLDLESFSIGGTFPTEIHSLIHLRYFAIQTDANSIPSSIAKLWNLETFVVRGLGGEVILPYSLLNMVKLRHVLVTNRASFSMHENVGASLASSELKNLETFSTPRLSHGEDAEMILTKMSSLRKLSCIFSGTFGYSEKVKGRCVLFPRLECLSRLESLKLVSNSYPAKLQHEFSFPSNLRELTMSKFRLPWSQISTIGQLPNLEILKLLLRAFDGEHWEVSDSEFPELKYLKLDNLNIKQWVFPEDAFPKLERLVLTKCERLENIPSQFGESISLQSIDVNWCRSSAANSALEIQTTQHECYASYVTVTIQSSA